MKYRNHFEMSMQYSDIRHDCEELATIIRDHYDRYIYTFALMLCLQSTKLAVSELEFFCFLFQCSGSFNRLS